MADNPEFHIVMDTNCLYTEAEDKLLSKAASEFIRDYFDGPDVKLNWYLPNIVRSERHFQMAEKAERFLSEVAKVEKLLGKNFGVTRDALQARIDEIISDQVKAHRLEEIGLDTANVNWEDIIKRSVNRVPPFERRERSEKGFRDAVLFETFWQLVPKLPEDPKVARIVLISDDEVLGRAMTERIDTRHNITVLSNLDALKSTLNAVASHLAKADVDTILATAESLFRARGEEGSILELAGKRIDEDFAALLQQKPASASTFSTMVTTKAVSAYVPTFLSKQGDILTFSSRITVFVETRDEVSRAYQPPGNTVVFPGNVLSNTAGTIIPSAGTTFSSQIPSALSGHSVFLPSSNFGSILPSAATYFTNIPVNSTTAVSVQTFTPSFEIIRHECRHDFEVIWSATFTGDKTLIDPKLVQINHIGTDWERKL
jgi:hypothetical protein